MSLGFHFWRYIRKKHKTACSLAVTTLVEQLNRNGTSEKEETLRGKKFKNSDSQMSSMAER
jgi:hypothetical protein